MITIKSYNQSSNSSSLAKSINTDNSILIVGKGNSDYGLNDIIKPSNSWEMNNLFGDSDLTNAYTDAIRSGAENVFVMNCYQTTDFIDAMDFIKNYNFAYIVPIGIKMSDTFYSGTYKKQMYFGEYYLKELSNYINSLIIFTDEHASLYENIDHYLNDMHEKIDDFKDQCSYILEHYGRNIAFCLNNLKNKNYANIILASKISQAVIGNYPEEVSYEAIFDIDEEDIYIDEIIYFKNNIHVDTTIENLQNFRTTLDANKIITIDIVIKHIERTLDTSFVLGKLYSQYVKMSLYDYIDLFLRNLMGISIENYAINEITFVATEKFSGYMTVDLDIYPLNSLEKINTTLEVR